MAKNIKKLEEKDADVLIVTAPIKIDDGKHTGEITNVIRKLPNITEGRNFDYMDFSIKVTDANKTPEIRTGFPTNLSELSSLGRFLIKSGMSFGEGDEITMDEIKTHLIGKEITFLCKNEKTEQGEFARILRDTIEFV